MSCVGACVYEDGHFIGRVDAVYVRGWGRVRRGQVQSVRVEGHETRVGHLTLPTVLYWTPRRGWCNRFLRNARYAVVA
jgi:hypothetical protein